MLVYTTKMNRSHQTIKVWKSTLTLLKVIAAISRRTMVQTLHSMVREEAERRGINIDPN